MCSYEKVFWKYTVYLQENTHAECHFNKVAKHSKPSNNPNKSSKYSKQNMVSLTNLATSVIFN